jgi:hypothetical protein
LDKPAKLLIGGIFAGALVYGLGEMNAFRLERKVQELQRPYVLFSLLVVFLSAADS